MENDKEIKYQKVKLRFLYVSIILVLIIISLISLFFYRNVNAWLFLSFAGTAISIVLSVIAILITLIDVAGQRQQISDISESAKALAKSSETLKQSIKDYQNDKDEIRHIINSTLKESIGDKLEEQAKVFINMLEGLKTESNGNEKLEESIKDIKNMLIKSTEIGKTKVTNKDFKSNINFDLYDPKLGLYKKKIIIKTKKKIAEDKIKKIKDYLNSKNLYLAFIENKENKLVINANTYLISFQANIYEDEIKEIIKDYIDE
ncbi:hypothetical protein [Staphylococcus haemolyticus]|uniref:hypothetical protein n=6 Tax=Staphylococcus haemolyticus TaxID=1283 RepID=UPI0034D3B1E9